MTSGTESTDRVHGPKEHNVRMSLGAAPPSTVVLIIIPWYDWKFTFSIYNYGSKQNTGIFHGTIKSLLEVSFHKSFVAFLPFGRASSGVIAFHLKF